MEKRRRRSRKPTLAETHPEIASQWHPTRNKELRTTSVTHGSGKKVWWNCSVSTDHEWTATISNRTARRGTGCPFCAGKKLSKTTSLSDNFPDLVKEWHPTKNGKRKPQQVLAGSRQNAWWQCSTRKTHVWSARISHRTVSGSGCPFCARQRLDKAHSLAVSFPSVARQWHKEKNRESRPSRVAAYSNNYHWWICPKSPDHVWKASISNRTNRGSGCPFCAGKKVSVTNSLEKIFPRIAAEWHPTKNKDRVPSSVVSGSGLIARWLCPVDLTHEWRARVAHRTGSGSGCPICTMTPRSAQEIRLAHELGAVIDLDLNKHKIRTTRRIIDADIVVDQLNTIVEFDGAYWHRDKKERDLKKTTELEDSGWIVVRVREKPLTKIHKNDVLVNNHGPIKEIADRVLAKLVQKTLLPRRTIARYLKSSNPWREQEALKAIREYQKAKIEKRASRKGTLVNN